MTDDVVIDLSEDREFHQATGIVSVQLGTTDMSQAGRRLVAMAAQRGEPVHATSLLVIGHHLRLSSDFAIIATRDTHDGVLGQIRAEIDGLFELLRTRPLDFDERLRYEALGRREMELLHPD
jgi:hypothetical protein